MFFDHAVTNAADENSLRHVQNSLTFGIDYLDHATSGIAQNDLILIGAPSGIGKTELCCTIAIANLCAFKRVHYIALEAEPYEIERRLKYRIFADLFYKDPNRPRLESKISYAKWYRGEYLSTLERYEQRATELSSERFKTLWTLYKRRQFNVNNLIEAVLSVADETDLIIIDHVHYFDFDDDNENRAIKNIAMTVRTLALEQGIPIILVAHLRKRDRNNDEMVAGLDEFHGSSDLYKIATKVVTLASGGMDSAGTCETFFRVPKNRQNGSATRFIGQTFFNPRNNSYDKGYKLGWASSSRSKKFAEIDLNLYPEWARGRASGSGDHSAQAEELAATVSRYLKASPGRS